MLQCMIIPEHWKSGGFENKVWEWCYQRLRGKQMRIYQARREKLRGLVSSLPVALVAVTEEVQLLEGRWAVVERLSHTVQRHHLEHCSFQSSRKKIA